MIIVPSKKIEPLRDDLHKIFDASFFRSTAFKRCLIEFDYVDDWNLNVSLAIESLRGVPLMGACEDVYYNDALTLTLNNFYDNEQFDDLVRFIGGALKAFCEENTVSIDLKNIKKDLKIANVNSEYINKLVNIVIDENPTNDSIESGSGIVRNLEKKYREIMAKFGDNSTHAIEAYLEWHSAAVAYLGKYFSSENEDFQRLKVLNNAGNGFSLRDNYYSIRSIYDLLMQTADNVRPSQSGKKSPMVFISHSFQDKQFVEALVDLLESMGLDNTTVFCSSVVGYGVKYGNKIFETLRDLYTEHDLFVLFIHSPRYYRSHVSLNEMGAAWVLRSKHRSFLTNDMTFDKMTGVINGQELSLKVDNDDAEGLLIQFKNDIIDFFGLQPIDEQKWARKSNHFLDVVRNIVIDEKTIDCNDIDAELKSLQIEKLRAEAEEKKKAIIRSRIVSSAKAYNRDLCVNNSGMCSARNLKIEWLNPSADVIFMQDLSDIDVLPSQGTRTYRIALCKGAPATMHLRYSWKDELSDFNECEDTIQLL